MQTPNDYSLWKSLQKGQKESLDALYKKYIQSLYNYGKNISTDHDLVKDCIQDLFVDLWQQRERITLPSHSKLYLFKALRFKIIHQKRKYQKIVFHSTEHEYHSVPPYEQHLISEQMGENQRKALQQAMQKLSIRQKEALQLRFFEGLSNDEIASVMNLQSQSIYNLIHQAVNCLKNELNPSLLVYNWAVIILFALYLMTLS